MSTRISKVLLLSLACLVLSSKATIIGAWMTPYKAEARDYNACVTQLTKLKGLGVSRIYVDAYANGFMHSVSATWQRDVPNASQGDYVGNVIKCAEAVGLMAFAGCTLIPLFFILNLALTHIPCFKVKLWLYLHFYKILMY